MRAESQMAQRPRRGGGAGRRPGAGGKAGIRNQESGLEMGVLANWWSWGGQWIFMGRAGRERPVSRRRWIDGLYQARRQIGQARMVVKRQGR
jgi:hypothetical protein